MGRIKRKYYWLDESIIRKAQKLFGVKSETEAVQKALEMSVFQEEAAKAWRENAGYGGVKDLYAR